MTFDRFFSTISTLKPLDFISLDEPERIVTQPDDARFLVCAVAITIPSSGDAYAYGLAIKESRGIEQHQPIILCRSIGRAGGQPDPRRCWVAHHRAFSYPWVREWLAIHPVAAIKIGISLGRALESQQLKGFVYR